ncbi:hypothetical protein HELRODRAFT_161485 [Helobdella robusta]|uniref:Doublecortin domain-containing protein n=1 Tax=Helobdella robusta TaxID=6412 RepID=T1ERJ1_HELRO|nr:hypothetical protein HELRODRAFT_161485 [Helobdella robusta]ESO02240.1 hypothetical protein HELRODRAFT_161485 [Helobdella robusta]
MDNNKILRRISETKWMGKRITLMRNGNTDFKGTKIVVSEKMYPDFNLLIDEICKMKVSRLPDSNALGQLGTRYIYNKNGEMVTSISQFQSGEQYICCAAPFVKTSLLPYPNSAIFNKMHDLDSRSNAKTIFIILAGFRPRTIACLLLMKKLEITFTKLVQSVSEFLNITPDKIHSIVTIDDIKVTNVQQFFDEKNSIFIVFMSSKRLQDDLLLSVQGIHVDKHSISSAPRNVNIINAELDFINSTLHTQELEKKNSQPAT